MKRASLKAHCAQRRTIFTLFASTILLLAVGLNSSATNAVSPQAGWRVQLEEGKTSPSTLTIGNHCSSPHFFRIKSKIKYLRFEEAVDSVLVGPNSTRQIRVMFDATGLKSKVYRDKVIVECLECKKERTCSQDRDEVTVELTVTKPAAPQPQGIKNVNRPPVGVIIHWKVFYGNKVSGLPGGPIPLPMCPCPHNACKYVCSLFPIRLSQSTVGNVIKTVGTVHDNFMAVDFRPKDLKSTRTLNFTEDSALDEATARELGYRKITFLKGSYEVSKSGSVNLAILAEQ
jgi:hypothetical protein